MKERPILFSAPMVRAILDGRKTQTRRIIKNIGIVPGIGEVLNGSDDAKEWPEFCPYGKPGDRLWVRETHWMDKRDILCAVMDLDGFAVDAHQAGRNKFVKDFDSLKNNKFWKKRSSIHMPRIVSRILLEITGVRVERLINISNVDAIAEGIELEQGTAHWKNYDTSPGGWRYWNSPVQSYRTLWESLNGTGSWNLNPWVWVVEFKVLEVKK